jgi:uncharacterized membrane protein required for colicin V production
MPSPWAPRGILDWALLVYVALGAWNGYRRGLLLSLGSLAAYAGALAVATLGAGRVLAAADRAWALPARVAAYLPGAAGGAAGAVTARALGWAAFAAVFLVAHMVFALAARAFVGRSRSTRANAWLGLAFGAVERGLVAAVALAVAASLAGLPPLHALAGALAASNWAQDLLGWLHRLPPAVGRWALLPWAA